MSALAVDVTVDRGTFQLEASFEAPTGRTVAVLGPNGSGKTTLLSAIAGLEHIARGRIVADGTVFDDVGSGIRLPPQQRRCAVVFSDLRLFPALSVVDNVAFGLRAAGTRRAAARRRVASLLEELGLGALAGRRIADLSGGEAQRVALARALAGDPRVLLLDEALSALDVRTRAQTRALLRRAVEPLDIPRLVVTHDPVEALSLADHLVVLEGGAVTWAGLVGNLPADPTSPFLASIVGLNVVRGTIRRSDSDAWVAAAGVDLFAVTDLPAGARAIGVFAPSAVTLSADRPSGSARNVMPATVTAVTSEGGRAHVRLDGAVLLHADVTAASVTTLGLRPGTSVWASVKATEVRVEAS